MILIIGGAYQGKLDYARSAFSLSDEDIFTCSCAEIDFSKRCICSLESFVRHHPNPLDYFKNHRVDLNDHILICRDIFCGVVPLGADNRNWRQETGRLCQYLAGEADQVIRIFCGLEQRLK